MTVYAWPVGWALDAFQMRIKPSAFVSSGPYSPYAQVTDLVGEVWIAQIDLQPGVENVEGAAREAFFDRLNGPFNQISLYHLRRPEPLGTLRDGVAVNAVNASSTVVPVVNASAVTVPTISGSPVVLNAIARGEGTATVRTVIGRTLRAGDHVALGSQTVRVMADATANGSGQMAIEFRPRARAAIAAYSAITWNRPTVNFTLKAGGVPTVWRQGMFEGTSIELVEAP
jgi:hypothetical protein